MKDAGRCSGTYSLLGRYRALTMSVFGIVENFDSALYAGTRGILSGFFIILVVRFCGNVQILSVGFGLRSCLRYLASLVAESVVNLVRHHVSVQRARKMNEKGPRSELY